MLIERAAVFADPEPDDDVDNDDDDDDDDDDDEELIVDAVEVLVELVELFRNELANDDMV